MGSRSTASVFLAQVRNPPNLEFFSCRSGSLGSVSVFHPNLRFLLGLSEAPRPARVLSLLPLIVTSIFKHLGGWRFPPFRASVDAHSFFFESPLGLASDFTLPPGPSCAARRPL